MLFSSLGISRLIEFYFGRREREGEERGDIRICEARGLFFRMHAYASEISTRRVFEFSGLEKRDGTRCKM